MYSTINKKISVFCGWTTCWSGYPPTPDLPGPASGSFKLFVFVRPFFRFMDLFPLDNKKKEWCVLTWPLHQIVIDPFCRVKIKNLFKVSLFRLGEGGGGGVGGRADGGMTCPNPDPVAKTPTPFLPFSMRHHRRVKGKGVHHKS